MRKIRTVCFILCCGILLLGGCGKRATEKPVTSFSDGVTVTLPQDDSLNGYKKDQPLSPQAEQGRYFANMDTLKFHLASCTYAGKIKPENLLRTNDRKLLTDAGYTPCKFCDP